ncbi:MAG: DUF1232 domain-containing protein [Acidimicrobiia bacterium]|nr:DUF1232 domain-containing protein [Acidimicrobiia bacterium]MYA38732.1 DUF1232 domain-containing protein [Acidimicrobiia bacterium]MYD41312.1 DUF1232 domain-containing protein [Acidimicrobiia bacterium]MYJ15130.1 DUF1232 domain-containing protein [Acidimicrobiia bacterium]MYK55669.1 DUF1232 domain-containing protein [Acidimicrobiia bacterium]
MAGGRHPMSQRRLFPRHPPTGDAHRGRGGGRPESGERMSGEPNRFAGGRRLVVVTLTGLASSLPQFARLVARLSRDRRVPVRAKRLAAGLAVYAVVPLDLIPDVIPVVGLFDDLLAVVVALAVLIEAAPDEVVAEHWDGEPEALERILLGVDLLIEFMPRRVRWMIRWLVGGVNPRQ